MHSPVRHFFTDHFPELGHPVYQTLAEKVTFIVVTTMLIGLLLGALGLIVADV